MRELPNDIVSEQAILGAILFYPAGMSVAMDEQLTPSDFYQENHQVLFEVMVDMYQEGEPISLKSVFSKLSDKDLLRVADAEYLTELVDNGTVVADLKYYIDTVRNKADQRNLILVANKIANEGYSGDQNIDDLLNSAERELLAVTQNRRGVSDFAKGKDVISVVLENIEQARNNNGELTGLATKFNELDSLTDGLQKGDLIILAARPSVGKTAFALNIALNASNPDVNNNAKVAIFSLEMPSEQLMRRILSAESHVEGNKLRSGDINDGEANSIYQAADRLNKHQLFIDDTSGITVNEIFSKCRKLKSDYGLDLIIIDYLQLIKGRGGSDRQQEVSEISRSLKMLARDMGVPVIALSQLSRSIEQRQDRTPQLSDLRESGSIEQDADIVMFLSRDDYQKSNEAELEGVNNDVILSVKKHRNGGLKDITLCFDKDYNKFNNPADSYTEHLAKELGI